MVLCELQAVYRALIHQEGTFLSISEINTLISKEHGVILSPHTVVAKIDKLKNTGHIINERIEPKGKNKIPTKTFQYISKISKNEHSSN